MLVQIYRWSCYVVAMLLDSNIICCILLVNELREVEEASQFHTKGIDHTIHSAVPSLLCQKDSAEPKLTRGSSENRYSTWGPPHYKICPLSV